MRHLALGLLSVAALALPAPAATAVASAPPPPPGVSAGAPPEVDAALRHYQQGDAAAAIALLEPLVGQPGEHPGALALLGKLYVESGRPGDALALLGPAADDESARAVVLQAAANAALAAGEPERADRYLERIVAMAPGSSAARDLGILRGSQGRVAEGYRLLRPWALAHPKDVEARLSAAYGAVELDRPPEAMELLAGLPETEPRAQLLRGRVRLLTDDPAGAAALLEPLLGTAPAGLQGQVRRFLAQAKLASGKSQDAIAVLAGHSGADPSLALLLARAHFQGGAPEQSVAALEPLVRELLAQGPEEGEAALAADLAREYGQALVALSRWPRAIESLELATRLAPERLEGWQLLSRAQLAGGQRSQALQSLERFRQLQSKQAENSTQVRTFEEGQADPTARNLRRAAELAAAGKVDEALAAIREERLVAPGDPRPRAAEVLTLAGAGRRAEALQAVGGDPGTLTALAERLLPMGGGDEARALLALALELRPGDARATALLQTLQRP